MNTYWGVEVQLHALLTSALGGGEWSASRYGRLTPQGKIPRYSLDRRHGMVVGPSTLIIIIIIIIIIITTTTTTTTTTATSL